jgi:selenocysteine lyase/cysteine desulfurase
VRASLAFCNTIEEIDRLAGAAARLAGLAELDKARRAA